MNTVQSSGGGHSIAKGKEHALEIFIKEEEEEKEEKENMSDSNLRKQSGAEEKQKRVTLATPLGKEELVVSTPNQRNWRGMLIALLVILAVLGLIICSILLLSPPDEGPRVKGTHFTLESITGNQFIPKLFNGTWISDIELIYRDYNGGLKIFCVENYTTRSLMTNVTFRQINAVDYKVSPDLNYVLLMTDIVKIWTYSFKARYYIYEVATQEHFPLRIAETGNESEPEQLPLLESVTWTPSGNGLVFVYKNNLYYRPRMKRLQTYTLTRDGVENVIFNGRPDYIYETKILEIGTALWFSPDSALLAFATFNCSEVGNMQFPYYGHSIYEEIESIRLPKPGTPNPKVKLTIVNMSFPKIMKNVFVQPPSAYAKSEDYYMTGVQWINSTELAITWMNRRQTMTSVSLCKKPKWVCVDVYQDKLVDNWVSKIPNPIFDNNGTWFLAILPVQDGDQGRYPELCQVDSTSRKHTFLTNPPMTVLEILAWDLESHSVYFIATLEPGNRHLFRTGDRNSSQRQWDCLTCYYDNGTLANGKYGNWMNRTAAEKNPGGYMDYMMNTSLEDGERSPHCLFAKAYFNSIYNPRYYVLDCLGPEVPSTVVVDAGSNTILSVLNANTELRNLFHSMAIPQIKTFQVELESGYHAQVRLYLPPGLREYEPMVFPLILHVDSAPGSQLVNEKFNVNWWWYLSGHRNFIVAEIDARGAGFQGENMIREINGKIGTVEVEDQIAVVSYLRDTLKFVDKHRMGVFGEGYGGYVAAMILMQDRDLFRCGASVNPITSFLLTDAFTTERFLGMPNGTESYRAYDEADLNKKAGNLNEDNGKQFLLVSSTGNIEVPVQHSMNLINALVRENAIFKHQIYPDVGHDMSEVAHHYYKMLDSFWDECFAPLDLQDWETMASFIPFTKE